MHNASTSAPLKLPAHLPALSPFYLVLSRDCSVGPDLRKEGAQPPSIDGAEMFLNQDVMSIGQIPIYAQKFLEVTRQCSVYCHIYAICSQPDLR
jgi:hypothetical protein